MIHLVVSHKGIRSQKKFVPFSPWKLSESSRFPLGQMHTFLPIQQHHWTERVVILCVCVYTPLCLSVCMFMQVFSLPVEERRYKEMAEQQFGERGREQAKTCAEIMAKTGQ